MALQYVDYSSGVGARQNVLWTASTGTKQELINQIETVLLAAGWTTISGHATTNLLMQSVLTPQSLQTQLRVKDNGGVCVTLSLQNVAGTKVGANSTTAGVQLLPAASKVWRMVANKYQAFIYTQLPTAATREFAAFGTPWLPSNITTLTECMWLLGMGTSDTDTGTGYRAFRNYLTTVPTTNTVSNCGYQQTITQGTVAEVTNSSSCGGIIQLGGNFGGNGFSVQPYRMFNQDAMIVDPWISWGQSGAAGEGMFMGMLWDAGISTESFAGDLVVPSYTDQGASHTGITVTNNNNGTSGYSPRGTLFLVTS